eukprot:Filipodium_phascolosomae@DN1269_c0_g1_i2.p1
MCITALWPTGSFVGADLFVFIGITCGLFVILVGLIGGAIALNKSTKLEKVREGVRQKFKGSYQDAFNQFVSENSIIGGIGQGEFVRMSSDCANIEWQSGDELSLIFNALCDFQSDVIREHEFARWMTGAWTIV